MPTCFFCGELAAEDDARYQVDMYKVTSDNSADGSKESYVTKTIDVPRCSRCKSVHSFRNKTVLLSSVALGVLWFWYFVFANPGVISWIDVNIDSHLGGNEDCSDSGSCMTFSNTFPLIGLFMGVFISIYVSENFINPHVKPIQDANSYISVDMYLENGYKIGEHP